jgi:hypothetical protein
VKIIDEQQLWYGECGCGSDDWKILIESPEVLETVGIRCSECGVMAMFDDEYEYEDADDDTDE